MDSASISDVSKVFSIATPLLICGVFLWAIWRTESRHVLIRRLWQLVHGNQEISDPEIRAFVDEQTSLVSFRMFAGLPVTSLEKARELIRWAKLNGVQMRTLRMCGEFFDPDTREVNTRKLPSQSLQGVKLAGFAIAVLPCAASAASLVSSRSLLSLKATNRFFLATTTDVKPLWPLWPFDETPLRASNCSASNEAIQISTSFTPQEVGILCEILKDEGSANFFKDALKEQRWSAALLFLFCAWLSWIALFAWAAGAAARRLADRRLDPALPGSQLSLDLGN